MRFGVWGVGVGFWSLGFGFEVWGVGCGFWGLGFGVQRLEVVGLGFWVQLLGFGDEGTSFALWNSVLKISERRKNLRSGRRRSGLPRRREGRRSPAPAPLLPPDAAGTWSCVCR